MITQKQVTENGTGNINQVILRCRAERLATVPTGKFYNFRSLSIVFYEQNQSTDVEAVKNVRSGYKCVNAYEQPA